ncbi:hypothetical protein ACU686_44740 [Yinghuangia aomiensis]
MQRRVPSRRVCLEDALAANPSPTAQAGYRGGTSPARRATILRARRRALTTAKRAAA